MFGLSMIAAFGFVVDCVLWYCYVTIVAFGFGFRVAGGLVICCSLWVQFRWVCL